MGRLDESNLPPKVKAAFEFLFLARAITEQTDASIPMRALSPLEKSVEAAALRTIQQYLMGEMDFELASTAPPSNRNDDNGPAPEKVPAS